MSAFENGKDTINLIWDLYFWQGKSKIQVHQESGLSRTTIDKYIRIIEKGLSDDVSVTENDCGPFPVDQFSSNLPTTYITRKKRVSTPETKELILKDINLWKSQHLTVSYKKFCKKYPRVSISYSTFYRIIKQSKM